jgi:hypothetical protein
MPHEVTLIATIAAAFGRTAVWLGVAVLLDSGNVFMGEHEFALRMTRQVIESMGKN